MIVSLDGYLGRWCPLPPGAIGLDHNSTDYRRFLPCGESSMPILNRIADFHEDLTQWRRDIHAHPETAFEERRTSDVVAQRLQEFGIEIHRGLAGTGVVGALKGSRPGARASAIRADMDALDVHEKNGFQHCSTHKGKMHACGHDGHTTMLLGAARYLAESRNFAGTVHFIFQ